MAASNAFKRLLVRRLAYGADIRGRTLLDRIREVAFSKLDVLRDGRVVVQSTSGNRSSTVQLLSGQGVTPAEITEALEQLIGLHGEVVSALTQAEQPVTDADVEREMIFRLPSVVDSTADFSGINDGWSQEASFV